MISLSNTTSTILFEPLRVLSLIPVLVLEGDEEVDKNVCLLLNYCSAFGSILSLLVESRVALLLASRG